MNEVFILTPLKSFPICGIRTPGRGPAGYPLGPINCNKMRIFITLIMKQSHS